MPIRYLSWEGKLAFESWFRSSGEEICLKMKIWEWSKYVYELYVSEFVSSWRSLLVHGCPPDYMDLPCSHPMFILVNCCPEVALVPTSADLEAQPRWQAPREGAFDQPDVALLSYLVTFHSNRGAQSATLLLDPLSVLCFSLPTTLPTTGSFSFFVSFSVCDMQYHLLT